MTLKNLKYIIVAVIIAALIAILMLRILPKLDEKVTSVQSNGLTVLIDPGHGGNDPGAVSENGTRECDLNLTVALHLKQYLESMGFTVVMTRTDNGSITNDERKEIMRQTECDIAVSIHMNKFSDKSVHGAETFYYSESNDGKLLAECVQESLKRELDTDNRRTVKGTTKLFAVKTSSAPSILVECGYISNAEEEALLTNTVYQKKLAMAIGFGIQSFCFKK